MVRGLFLCVSILAVCVLGLAGCSSGGGSGGGCGGGGCGGSCCGGRSASNPPPPSRGAMYVCPMHSNVTSAQPGRCSVCGMDLQLRQ